MQIPPDPLAHPDPHPDPHPAPDPAADPGADSRSAPDDNKWAAGEEDPGAGLDLPLSPALPEDPALRSGADVKPPAEPARRPAR